MARDRFLDSPGITYLWGRIKELIKDTVLPSSEDPLMDGDASPGSSDYYSRADHVHPKDDSKQDKITADGLLKGDGQGGISSAVEGEDYAAVSHEHSASDITSGVLGVARGGTGAGSFQSNSLVETPENGGDSFGSRGITAYTQKQALSPSINIPTMGTVYFGLNYALGRLNAVNEPDTSYSSYIARGESLNSYEVTPSVNGTIAWEYE